MKKDSTRDYIIAAFRLYAALEQPNENEIKNSIFPESVKNDLMSVNLTIANLNNSGKGHIAEAVKKIYFCAPLRELKKGEIESRVTAFAVDNYFSTSSVWNWLKEARCICADYRGLNNKSIKQILKIKNI